MFSDVRLGLLNSPFIQIAFLYRCVCVCAFYSGAIVFVFLLLSLRLLYFSFCFFFLVVCFAINLTFENGCQKEDTPNRNYM